MLSGNQINICLLGTSFTIRADQSLKDLRQTLWLLEKRIEEVASSSSLDDPVKIAILTAFCLVDELIKEKKSENGSTHTILEDAREMERITLGLISQIDEVISE